MSGLPVCWVEKIEFFREKSTTQGFLEKNLMEYSTSLKEAHLLLGRGFNLFEKYARQISSFPHVHLPPKGQSLRILVDYEFLLETLANKLPIFNHHQHTPRPRRSKSPKPSEKHQLWMLPAPSKQLLLYPQKTAKK